MTSARPILAKDTTAAKLLDMSTPRFRELVKMGSLPKPVELGGEERWIVDDIMAIVTGRAARPDKDEDIAI